MTCVAERDQDMLQGTTFIKLHVKASALTTAETVYHMMVLDRKVGERLGIDLSD
jgi:hypothetical protein